MSGDISTLWRSFAGGEITPELYGRLDLQKFQTGLALCRNFIVLPHGPVTNRPGTEYILEVKDSTRSTRVVPFSYNTDETFVLEVGHLYIRFHTNGSTVVETAKNITGITQANPGVVTIAAHGYSNGQWVFLSGIGGMTQLNGRFVKVANATANTFTMQALDGTAINTTAMTAYTSSGAAQRVYEIATPYSADAINLLTIHYAQSNDVLTLTHPSYDPRELTRTSITSWTLTTISTDPTIAAPVNVVATALVGSGSETYDYAVTAVSEDGEESFISASSSVTNALWTAGNKNGITWDAVTGAIRYNVYRSRGGLFSYIGQAATNSFEDDFIQPDTSTTPPESSTPFVGADNYPSTVSYFEQRRVFAATDNRQQTLWMTRAGSDSSMSGSIPTREDDAISFRIASREANRIRHIIPLEDLILLTSSAAWKVASKNSDAITPSTISVKPMAYIGASDVQPVVNGNSILYGMERGGHLAELKYSWEQNGYQVQDASIMAPHLVDGYSITDLAFMTAPYKTCWAVRSDGELLGMTYVPQHQVLGWHHHNTDGSFESVAVVGEGDEEAAYFVIRRTINGRTVRYIERLHSPRFDALADAFYVDAGETYSGAPVTQLTGLYHLEGKEVSILADGAVAPRQTVTNGAITLEHAASKVHVGLPYQSNFQSLPLAYEAAAFGQGAVKNVNKVYLRIYRSSGILAGPDFNKLKQYKQRTTEPYGSPPDLKTGVASVVIDPKWTDDGQVCVRQSDPLPLTIAAMTLDVAAGD